MVEQQELPTLKQHVALILVLLRASPNKEFSYMYRLCQQLVSNSELHQIVATDTEYFTSDKWHWFPKENTWVCRCSIETMTGYYYDRVILTAIGHRTMRWFVETQLVPMIELHLKLASNDKKEYIVTLESVENLL